MRTVLTLGLAAALLGGCGDGTDVHPGLRTQRQAQELVNQSRERLKDPALAPADTTDPEAR